MVKGILFLGDALTNLKTFPEDAKRLSGFCLRRVQQGITPENAKPLRNLGSGIHGIMELVIHADSDTFRVVYLAKFKTTIYVLHAFQKKSTHGIATPKSHIDLIINRYKEALLLETTPLRGGCR
jgi:phage-related protein